MSVWPPSFYLLYSLCLTSHGGFMSFFFKRGVRDVSRANHAARLYMPLHPQKKTQLFKLWNEPSTLRWRDKDIRYLQASAAGSTNLLIISINLLWEINFEQHAVRELCYVKSTKLLSPQWSSGSLPEAWLLIRTPDTYLASLRYLIN